MARNYKHTVWLVTAYFPNDLEGTIATTRAVDTMLRQKHGARIININIDLLISYKVHQSLSKGTHLTAIALIVYGR